MAFKYLTETFSSVCHVVKDSKSHCWTSPFQVREMTVVTLLPI